MSFVNDVAREIGKVQQTRRTLRIFGIIHAGLFLLIALFIWYRHAFSFADCLIGFMVFGALAAIFLLSSIFFPSALKPVHRYMLMLGIAINWILIRFILVMVFFLVITPISWIMTLAGHDALHLKSNKGEKTFWIERKTLVFDKERCRRLF